MKLKLKKNEIPVLRNCRRDGTSRVVSRNDYGDIKYFQWPLKIGAIVKPVKWVRDYTCGNGLHGFAYGNGDHSLLMSRGFGNRSTLKYFVLAVNRADICNLHGKIKFSKCRVLHISTNIREAKRVIRSLTPKGMKCNSDSLSVYNYYPISNGFSAD